jgi:hypothetical protein
MPSFLKSFDGSPIISADQSNSWVDSPKVLAIQSFFQGLLVFSKVVCLRGLLQHALVLQVASRL